MKFMKKKSLFNFHFDDFGKNILFQNFHFYNYAKLYEYEIDNNFFLYACKYDYIELVKLLLNDQRIDINFTLETIMIYFY